MLNWLESVFTGIAGLVTGTWQSAIRAVIDAMRQLFRSVYSYHASLYGNVRNQWMRFTRATYDASFQVRRFMYFSTIQHVKVRQHDIPYLTAWLKWLGGTLRDYINQQAARLDKKIDAGLASEHHYARSIWLWVIEHVLLFLYRILATVVSWIHGIGSTMWHYFTHLDAFALLLFWHIIAALEKLAWDVAKHLGTFFLSLVVHNIVKFATLIESVIDAVL
jgi:hypothetical protein